MKILFVSTSAVGHIQPPLGLAIAARSRGHEIAWATARVAAPLLAAQSIDVLDTGASLTACRTEYFKRWPDAASHTGRKSGAHAFPRLFASVIASEMLPGLERAVNQWRPNLIVNETGAAVAPLVARKFGIPHVAHSFGLPMPASTLHASSEFIAPLWHAAGYEVPEFCGLYDYAGIEISPPSLQAACPNPVLAKRALLQRPSSVTAAPTDRLPASLSEFLGSRTNSRASRPIIYVTFGTIFNQNPSFNAAINAASKINATFVVTTGQGASVDSVFASDAIPANVWLGNYVPQSLLLPLCSVVVSHAGSGTLGGAMSHGIPQLCLPQGADQFRNADALSDCGAGLMLDGENVNESSVVDAIHKLLDESSFRSEAALLRKEIQAMETPEVMVTALETLG
jgi:UDP:flavonoid glycosyltransferase YjiC (YdhE family)